MEENSGSVRGDLLKWAREQQELTMRWIQQQGGPGLGYQSEVEHCKKTEVRSKLLRPWVSALHVTEAFARGQVRKYSESPEACRGLAGEVYALVAADRRTDWSAMSPPDRVRHVLKLTAFHCASTPPIVLAYVLDLELTALEAILSGRLPVMDHLRQALLDLTTLPDSFFRSGLLHSAGEAAEIEEFLPVLQVAARLGYTPDDLMELIRRGAKPPAPPS